MDSHHFDAFTRALGGIVSRRDLLHALTGGIATSGWPFGPSASLAKKKKGKRKKKRSRAAVTATCMPDCVGRVCGPNSCGTGSCGSCNPVCQTCEGGVCVNKANGTDCEANFTCQNGACLCPQDQDCGIDNCCATGGVCVDSANGRCALGCGALCDDVGCACAETFETGIDFCRVAVADLCGLTPCDNLEDCGANEYCVSASTCGDNFGRCIEACPV
jgi:hypothetical protein